MEDILEITRAIALLQTTNEESLMGKINNIKGRLLVLLDKRVEVLENIMNSQSQALPDENQQS